MGRNKPVPYIVSLRNVRSPAVAVVLCVITESPGAMHCEAEVKSFKSWRDKSSLRNTPTALQLQKLENAVPTVPCVPATLRAMAAAPNGGINASAAGLAPWLVGTATPADSFLWNQFRFTDILEVRAVSTDPPGALIPPAIAPGAPIELGTTPLPNAGAPGGGVGVGGAFTPNAAGAAGYFGEEQIFAAINLLAHSLPDPEGVATSILLVANRMSLTPWTGAASGERDKPKSHGYAPMVTLQFGAIPLHNTGTVTSLLQAL
eukprot:5729213-Amphidinium_carterae.1